MEESKGVRYFIAHDGSKMAKEAYTLITDDFVGEADHVTICHCYDPKKTYLPKHMQADFLKTSIEAECSRKFRQDQFDLRFPERDPEMTTHEQVKEVAKDRNADLIVLGLHGRKKEGG